MARPKKKLVNAPPLLTPKPEIRKELEAWLSAEILQCRKKRDELKPRADKWRMTLAGKRPVPAIRSGASNLSVPLTSWAYAGVRARLNQGVLESDPIISVQPLSGTRETYGDQSCLATARALTRFVTSEFRNRRGLNAKSEMEKVIAEATQLGTSAWKVYPTPDIPKKIPPTRTNTSATNEVVPGRTVWQYVSYFDLIYWEGYGTDTQSMPFVGHEFDKPWHEIKQWAGERVGYYYPSAVADLEAFYGKDQGKKPELLRDHRVAELYLDYDIDGDGLLEPIVLDWHLSANKILRINWNWDRSGFRPIFMAQFDLNADPNCGLGSSVCSKLEGPQEEADAIHNIGIEAGKRGIAHLVVLRANSKAAEEFGGDTPVLPGDTIVTEDTDVDIQLKPLGDPRAAESAISLEEHNRVYVTRILGLDESGVGNLESGKRVPGGLGMAIKREGRVITEAALDSFAGAMEDAMYVTLDLWKQRLPVTALLSVLNEAEVAALQQMVFTVSDESVRNAFIISVNARDAALAEEEKKQELFALNQFLFSFYDRLNQLAMAVGNPQLPPAAKKALALIAERMERGVEALLTTIDSIPNPSELLVNTGEFTKIIEEAISTTPTVMPTAPEAGDYTTGDLGGGVS